MRQLSGLDSLFLELETRSCPMHVGSLLILDPRGSPAPFDFQAVLRHIEAHLHRVPSFRWRLVTPPLNLDRPYWVEDPDFDLEHHVIHRALPSPGSDEQLGILVADLMRRPLNRDMPLWQFCFISGLSRGRVALVCKVHHASVDGVSGADLLSVLLDTEPEQVQSAVIEIPQAEQLPSSARLGWQTVRMFARQPARLARLFRQTASAVTAMQHSRGSERSAQHVVAGIAPHTRFNRRIDAGRSYAFGSLSLPRIRAIRKAVGVSVNDVVLCLSATALRVYLDEKGELPKKSLWAGIPVSLRSEDEHGRFDNRVMMARSSLHTDVGNPLERLRAISARMDEVKQHQGGAPANLLLEWLDVPAPALFIQIARLYENFSMHELPRLAFNIVVSNIPGSSRPLYFAGARLLHNHPISIPYHGLSFNITVMSYRNRLDYGLTAHRESMPDIWHFAELFEAALDELHTAVIPS